MPQAAKQRPPQRYHDHGDTMESTGLYQMLGISSPFGCHGLCPAALLETHCVGSQVLRRCQKRSMDRYLGLKGMVTTLLQLTLYFALTMFLAFNPVTVQPKMQPGSLGLGGHADHKILDSGCWKKQSSTWTSRLRGQTEEQEAPHSLRMLNTRARPLPYVVEGLCSLKRNIVWVRRGGCHFQIQMHLGSARGENNVQQWYLWSLLELPNTGTVSSVVIINPFLFPQHKSFHGSFIPCARTGFQKQFQLKNKVLFFNFKPFVSGLVLFT